MRKFHIALFSIALISPALAQSPLTTSGVLRDDPRRPVDAISHDLRVTAEQFRDCFSNVNPAPKGLLPGSDDKRANKTVLLGCLQKANPAITNDSLDQVMDRYRPEGKAAQ